ncbi:MAG TPA: Asp-tRNA(Asn)/Glu-tRNA(Gln) amidotransferase subunit GatC [Geminicoccaceae bacterium]|nr:Asp-tRNA(Asn)/Glu-tRNA(Gln) amidotransferase subunit GatC [Geminicoccus sp.]HMU50614.1 Asp-tRNA(Asn)/Glu-tRNA(Gln) amidotransferase subunit GatC [Geminicoccaceae bacterium]
MSLDQAAVARIATLARIKLDEEQQAAMAKELSGILDWIAQLDEVDTRDTEPMRSVMDIRTSWRADTVTDGGRADDVLSNAPGRDGAYFVVPKVVE